MKNPRIIFIVTFFGSLFWLASCHNYSRNSAAEQANQKGDSTAKADSINAINGDKAEKAAYEKDLQFKIDSMNVQLNKVDSMYAKGKHGQHEKWEKARAHIKAGIKRLEARKGEIAGVKRNAWKGFKNSIDTAVQNIKYEWKNGE